MEYIVDTKKLRIRLATDGRKWAWIEKDASLPDQTIKTVLRTGKAEEEIINRIRLTIKPHMHFNTICPKHIQQKKKTDSSKMEAGCLTPEQTEILIKEYGDSIKEELELQKELSDLCAKYSTLAVFDMINEWQSNLLAYINETGFNLLELLDESLSDVPGFDLDENNQLIIKNPIRKKEKALENS